MPNTVSIKNPIPTQIPLSSVGIEQAIEPIRQELLSGLGWLEVAFNRGRIYKEDTTEGFINVPKIYVGDKDYYNLMPYNDNLDSYCFFLGRGGQFPTTDYTADSFNISFRKEVDLIFWGNLQRIDSDKDYIFISEMEQEVLTILSRRQGVRIVEVYDESPPQVFSGFSINDIHADKLYYPYFAFRIRFELTFLECALTPVDGQTLPYYLPFGLTG